MLEMRPYASDIDFSQKIQRSLFANCNAHPSSILHWKMHPTSTRAWANLLTSFLNPAYWLPGTFDLPHIYLLASQPTLLTMWVKSFLQQPFCFHTRTTDTIWELFFKYPKYFGQLGRFSYILQGLLFGIGIWIWIRTVENLRPRHHAFIVRNFSNWE